MIETPAPTRFQPVFVLLFLLPVLALVVGGCKTTVNVTGQNVIPPRFIEPLRFSNFTVTNIPDSNAISNLMNAKVFLGPGMQVPEEYDFLVLQTETNETRLHIETVKEYQAAIKAGAYARTTADMNVEEAFELAGDLLGLMQRVKPSRTSYWDRPHLDQLPVSIVVGSLDGHQDPDIRSDAAQGLTLKDYASNNARIHLTQFKRDGNALSFLDADNLHKYRVRVVMRGDFDGDGIEDGSILTPPPI